MAGESASQVKPLRRDAELNLARIMEAARDVFAESGYDGSMEQIAIKADVGIGTLYRRFPHKEDLFNAVTDLARERTIHIGEEVLAEVTPANALSEVPASLHRRPFVLEGHHDTATMERECRGQLRLEAHRTDCRQSSPSESGGRNRS